MPKSTCIRELVFVVLKEEVVAWKNDQPCRDLRVCSFDEHRLEP